MTATSIASIRVPTFDETLTALDRSIEQCAATRNVADAERLDHRCRDSWAALYDQVVASPALFPNSDSDGLLERLDKAASVLADIGDEEGALTDSNLRQFGEAKEMIEWRLALVRILTLNGAAEVHKLIDIRLHELRQ